MTSTSSPQSVSQISSELRPDYLPLSSPEGREGDLLCYSALSDTLTLQCLRALYDSIVVTLWPRKVGIPRWRRDGGREEGGTARHKHHPRGQKKEESSSRSGGERQISVMQARPLRPTERTCGYRTASPQAAPLILASVAGGRHGGPRRGLGSRTMQIIK